MGSEYNWYIKNRIIHARLFENVTEDDLRQGNILVTQFMDTQGTPPVHVIFDANAVMRVMITALQARNELHYLQDPRLGWLVIYGLRGIVEVAVHFIGGIINRTTNTHIHTVSSFDDALAFLRNIDPSLEMAE